MNSRSNLRSADMNVSMESCDDVIVRHLYDYKLDLLREEFDEENVRTVSSYQQLDVEKTIKPLFKLFTQCVEINLDEPILRKDKHVAYLKNSLYKLPSSYECLDASRAWICYWICHSLSLLDEPLSSADKSCVVNFLSQCQSPNGGFGGGPGQDPHIAATYAAVNCLIILGTPEAYNCINRPKLKQFLQRLKAPDGGFHVHDGGEVDIRGVYCALCVALLTQVYSEDLFNNTREWLTACQTYEGGFSGYPGFEAHGGYTFCGFAALCLLKSEHLCDIKALLRWTTNRQMNFEGGFQGRTNKLVDGCYSFWQGGLFPLIYRSLMKAGDTCLDGHWLFHHRALQEYILICCQHFNGGLLDKPEKNRDLYHTCYTLSGLSVAQHPPLGTDVIGTPQNCLKTLHPMYNIEFQALKNAISYFDSHPFSSDQAESS
ncbi:hypothetical protein M8J76_015629 [Diaphorina citri]|nr:hypothetical protein M8J75_009192 [Diaphorina citri]KAI5741638.1 hypothetical protein M8J76_015629 [Diaphorina citri]KAI5746913.1 hypothetical protein M8J77_008971 [Diaphorina citri]